jgi:long-chain acyl-CoA synthetase
MRGSGRISEISLLNAYASRPWLKLYRSGRHPVSPSPTDLLSVFRSAVDRDGNAPALHYFDCSYSYSWLDDQSDALAVWLVDEAQFSRGDRLAVILQNVPQFVVATVAAWKLGAVVMPCNPMYKEFELTRLLADGAPRAVICHREHYACVRASLTGAGFANDTQILTVCPRDLQSRQDDRILPTPLQIPAGSIDFASAISSRAGRRPSHLELARSEPALLLYTSGTTGVPKGAIISHRALAFNAHTSAVCCALRPAACIFALAPLFHITGFDLHMCVAFCTGGSVVLIYRFEPRVALDALRERVPTFTIGAIAAYIALMNTPTATVAHFASFDTLYTGGAPVPPAVLDQFAERLGRRLRSGYGMTELGGASHCAPCDLIPVDPDTGALAVGVPLPGVEAEIRDETGKLLPVGEAGELVIRGPLVMDCYLNKAEASGEALRDGWMHTGDIAFMDSDGWFYIVDRKKDMICASGYKVWPREVEDVLYQHPAVREAAVVGVPDEYRGETVLACVALNGNAQTNSAELIAFCRDRLATYKAPRRVEIFAELPKTVSGKIMRVELRRAAALAAGPPGGRLTELKIDDRK